MRAMFGLVALLVGVALMFYLFTRDASETLRVSKPMQDQAQQMSGRGEDGQSAMSSFKSEPQMQGNRLADLLVTEVAPGGAMDQYYGLKKGDQITYLTTQAGLQKISEASNNDPEMARAQVQETFQGSRPIVVMRGGKQFTLPASAAPAVTQAPAPGPTAVAPPPPAQTAQPQQPHNVYDQINQIKDAAGK